MRTEAVITLLGDLQIVELTSWIQRGWVQPDPAGDDWEFHEIDIARVRLIRDMRSRMELTDDAIPLVLSLLDQVYDLRGQLRLVLSAIETQPSEVRTAILSALR